MKSLVCILVFTCAVLCYQVCVLNSRINKVVERSNELQELVVKVVYNDTASTRLLREYSDQTMFLSEAVLKLAKEVKK